MWTKSTGKYTLALQAKSQIKDGNVVMDIKITSISIELFKNMDKKKKKKQTHGYVWRYANEITDDLEKEWLYERHLPRFIL